MVLVFQPLRDYLDGSHDIAFRLGCRSDGAAFLQTPSRPARSRPRCESPSPCPPLGYVPEIVIDVSSIYAVPGLLHIDILKEFVSRQILALSHDAGITGGPSDPPDVAPRSCLETRIGPCPSTRAWRSRIVVSPERIVGFAYSSLPTLISVVSSRRTTVAKIFLVANPARRSARCVAGCAATAWRTRASGHIYCHPGLHANAGGSDIVSCLEHHARSPADGHWNPANPHVCPGRRNDKRPDAMKLSFITQPHSRTGQIHRRSASSDPPESSRPP